MAAFMAFLHHVAAFALVAALVVIFYFSNAAFVAKLVLFLAVALLSIYPTVRFMRWPRDSNPAQVPAVRRVGTWSYLALK